MDNKARMGGTILFILIIITILVWGYMGGLEAQSVGVTCDMGLGDTFCWKWHTNVIGQTGEAIRDLFRG